MFGHLEPAMLGHAAFLLILGAWGLWVVTRRIEKLLLR
jgi:hypothetical protein